MKLIAAILLTLSAYSQTTYINSDWNIPVGQHTIPQNETFVVSGNINGNIVLSQGANLVIPNDTYTHNGHLTAAMEFVLYRRYNYVYWSSPVSNFSIFNIPPFGGETYVYLLGAWVNIDPTSVFPNTPMVAGKGYAMRGQGCPTMPNCGTINTAYNFSFNGQARNGHIEVTLNSLLDLIGNPYPSSISMYQFCLSNPNVTTIYKWPRISQPANVTGTPEYNYAAIDYEVVNLTGSNAPTPTSTDMLALGQGFFVKVDVMPSDSKIHFHNTMRGSGGVLAKNTSEKRVWLKLSADNILPSTMLVGYLEGADNNYNPKYDGEKMGTSANVLYSIIDDKKLAVQGRYPFDNADVVQLGITTTGGTFTITADQLQGIDNVYLKDNGVVYPLPHTFTINPGQYDNRFELVYENSLSINDQHKPAIYAYPNPATDYITICGDFNKYTLYDVLGQRIRSGNERTIDLKGLASGVYLLQFDGGIMKMLKLLTGLDQ